LVPREAVGFVIGKGGETIKEMMARSGAHIEVDRGDVDPATPTRVFNILGDARACAAARMLIGEKVTGVLHNKPTSAAGIPNVMLPGTANSRELWVPGDRVGSIIGARGQVVRRLQEQSGATIVIHNERVNSAAEKLVTIVGGVAETDHAASLIEDVIRKPRQPSLPSYPPALSGQVRPLAVLVKCAREVEIFEVVDWAMSPLRLYVFWDLSVLQLLTCVFFCLHVSRALRPRALCSRCIRRSTLVVFPYC